MRENFVLDAGEEGLGEDLIDDNVLPWLRGVVLLGEGLYIALAEETSGKVWGRIGDGSGGLEACRANFLALCWPGVVHERVGAISRHHFSSFSAAGGTWALDLGTWALGRSLVWTGNKVRLVGFTVEPKY